MQISYTLDQIDQVAKDLISFCEHKMILIEGEMGVGKTTLIKAIVKNLGSQDTVSSPTFSIVNEYEGIDEKPIYHFDFYRIKDQSEVEQLGLEEYFASNGWIFIEWPENINIDVSINLHKFKIKSINNEIKLLTVS